MESTTNYEQFKEVTANREVDPKHVKKLKKAIQQKNLLHVNPIIVNAQFKVIDGQHRLAAAESLKVPIFYIVDDSLQYKDISKLNSNQKNWSMLDYINFYAVEGVTEFQKFSRFAGKHNRFKISGLVSIVSEYSRRSTVEIKAGELNVFEIDLAEQVCQVCYDLNKKYGYDFVFDATFPIALKKAMKSEKFDLNNLYSKIDAAPRSFVSCRNEKEYIAMIEDTYNYKLSKNEIHIK